MRTFNIEVKFTPAYHAATNGAIENRHKTIKNALKASLVDMGNKHGDKWMQALPWVLLGKRVAYQPDLDTSAAMLAFGRSPLLPGQLLGHPGPPLTNVQVKALLEEMYKLEARPALQTSSKENKIDIADTEAASHVYIKVEEPKGLCPRFEGPYKVVSRPSRSQLEVRVGSYADGRARTLVVHWSSCKVAHVREDFVEGARPNIGRKPRPDPPSPPSQLTSKQNIEPTERAEPVVDNFAPASEPAKIQKTFETLSGREPHPDYLKKGPLITTEMFNKWTPDMLGVPSTRPVRTTRNQNPKYAE